MNNKIKIKILSIERNHNYCYECGNEPKAIIEGITKWDEVTQAEYVKISRAVHDANQGRKGVKSYFLIQQEEARNYQEIFDSAKEWCNHVEKERIKREEAAKKEKENREKRSLERKQKQLEKLKKELANAK